MNRHQTTNADAAANGMIEALYQQFVQSFYSEAEPGNILELAGKLRAALLANPDLARSIRGEEIASLLAEADGDYSKAVQSREAEIRKILELHTLAINSPSWEFVSRQYDFSDLSDRLDLLATLYEKQGDLDRAIDVLWESKRYCESHHIAFDGEDLLKEFEARLAKQA